MKKYTDKIRILYRDGYYVVTFTEVNIGSYTLTALRKKRHKVFMDSGQLHQFLVDWRENQ